MEPQSVSQFKKITCCTTFCKNHKRPRQMEPPSVSENHGSHRCSLICHNFVQAISQPTDMCHCFFEFQYQFPKIKSFLLLFRVQQHRLPLAPCASQLDLSSWWTQRGPSWTFSTRQRNKLLHCILLFHVHAGYKITIGMIREHSSDML